MSFFSGDLLVPASIFILNEIKLSAIERMRFGIRDSSPRLDFLLNFYFMDLNFSILMPCGLQEDRGPTEHSVWHIVMA